MQHVWVAAYPPILQPGPYNTRRLADIPCSTAGVQLLNGRQYAPNSSPILASYTTAQQEAKDFDNSRSHVRDLSVSRGRGPAPTTIATQLQQPGLIASPRSQSSLGRARSPAGLNGGLERRPSASQAHFCQASRPNGSYQQSRNAMFVSSPVTTSLSPETPGSANVDASLPDFSSLTVIRQGTSLRHQNNPPSATANGDSTHSSTTSTLIGDRDLAETNSPSSIQKRSDRAPTSRTRRGHSHHRSQSKHSQEQKSVGEYALHHLFNQVSFTNDCVSGY